MSRSEKDGVVSIPSKSSVSSSVCSVVNMVRSSVSGGTVRRSSVGLTATGLTVSRVSLWSNLITVFLLHLSGLSGEAGHSEHGNGGSSEAGHVHVLDGDDEVSWSSGDCGHGHAQTNQNLEEKRYISLFYQSKLSLLTFIVILIMMRWW